MLPLLYWEISAPSSWMVPFLPRVSREASSMLEQLAMSGRLEEAIRVWMTTVYWSLGTVSISRFRPFLVIRSSRVCQTSYSSRSEYLMSGFPGSGPRIFRVWTVDSVVEEAAEESVFPPAEDSAAPFPPQDAKIPANRAIDRRAATGFRSFLIACSFFLDFCVYFQVSLSGSRP